MKRSKLDAVVDEARAFADQSAFALPPFAGLSREYWLENVDQLEVALSRGLGWDVTDFGRGDFDRYGLCLCTVRNGSLEERDSGRGQTFAEKFMMVEIGQETPFHYHRIKTEDIVNRGGGLLVIELYPAAGDQLGTGSVRTLLDGVETTVDAGESITLSPGQSLQVPAGVFHRFWASERRVLAMEVSSVNDDEEDNTFLDPFPRYPDIEEDAPARYLLVSEYAGVLDSRGALM